MDDILSFPLVSVPRLSMLLRQFTYKPNFAFSVYSGGGFPKPGENGVVVWLKVTFYAENSVGPFRPWNLKEEEYEEYSYRDYNYSPYDGYRRVPPPPRTLSPRNEVNPVSGDFQIPAHISCEEEFWCWLREVPITVIENHERDEWFKVDKRAPFDPHNPQVPMPDPHNWEWRRRRATDLKQAGARITRENSTEKVRS